MDNIVIVKVDTIEKVKDFVNRCNEFSEDIDVTSGKYTIDGKSIMGMFSLNLFSSLQVRICSENEDTIKKFYEKMSDFI